MPSQQIPSQAPLLFVAGAGPSRQFLPSQGLVPNLGTNPTHVIEIGGFDVVQLGSNVGSQVLRFTNIPQLTLASGAFAYLIIFVAGSFNAGTSTLAPVATVAGETGLITGPRFQGGYTYTGWGANYITGGAGPLSSGSLVYGILYVQLT